MANDYWRISSSDLWLSPERRVLPPTPRFLRILEQQTHSVNGGDAMDEEGKAAENQPNEMVHPDRQAKLEEEYERNLAAGNSPYYLVKFLTRDELLWVLAKRGWILHDADLSGALLDWLDLSGISLPHADMRGASLWHANLLGAQLWEADLSSSTLAQADLSAADMFGVKLSGASLENCRMDASTSLMRVHLSEKTCLADVVWNGVPLTQIDWAAVPKLGDEYRAVHPDDEATKPRTDAIKREAHSSAARAYRQLSIALRTQGLNEPADNYAYRAHLMQREVFHQNKQWGPLILSWFLFLVSGYGYRLRNILITYGAVLLVFTFIFWYLGVHSFPHESSIQALWDSLLVSLSAIHGRTTFEQLGAWSPAAWWAAVESVCGIVVEGIFVAMLIQRFFAR